MSKNHRSEALIVIVNSAGFNNLKERGLEEIWLVVSDAHKGLVKASEESFLHCSWHNVKCIFCVILRSSLIYCI
jgi:transposase-like protein